MSILVSIGSWVIPMFKLVQDLIFLKFNATRSTGINFKRTNP